MHTAEKWCEFCGVSYWELAKEAQVTPKMLRLVTWNPEDRRVREALELSCEAMEVEPTPERIGRLAWTLATAAQGYVGTPVANA